MSKWHFGSGAGSKDFGRGVPCCLVGMGTVDKFEDCFDFLLSP